MKFLRYVLVYFLLSAALSTTFSWAGLETGTTYKDLVTTNPTATDSRAEGDDHLRLIKTTIKALGEADQDSSQIWCGTAGGTANALTLTPTPAITAYKAGRLFRAKTGAADNTGAATVQVSGIATPRAIQKQGAALVARDLPANSYIELLDDGTNFQLMTVDAATKGAVQGQSYVWAGTSGGSANAQTLTPTPAITAYAAGQAFEFTAGFTNTGATTFNISGVGAVSAYEDTGSAMRGGEIEVGEVYRLTMYGASTAVVTRLGGKYNLQRALNLAKSASTITAADTIDPFGVQDGNLIHITGSTQISNLTAAPYAGMTRTLIFDDKVTFLPIVTGMTTSVMYPGYSVTIVADTTTSFRAISQTTSSGYSDYETLTTTFDMSTASGATTYATFSFGIFNNSSYPKGIVLTAGTTAASLCSVKGQAGEGFGENGNMVFLYQTGTAGQHVWATNAFQATISSGNYQTFVVAYDAANQRFSFTNTKTGSPTGTLNITISVWK